MARFQGVVEALVGGRKHDAVGRAERARSKWLRSAQLPAVPQRRDVGIAELYARSLLLEDLDQVEGRRLADVVDVGLVGDSQNQDPRAPDGLPPSVQRLGDPVRDVVR